MIYNLEMYFDTKDMDTKEQIRGKICLEAYETKVYEV